MNNLNKYVDFQQNTPDFIRFVCEFLVDTGIRPKELWMISKSNLCYIDGKLDYFQPKTQLRRIVYLSPDVLEKARYFRKHFGNFACNFHSYKRLKNEIFTFATPKVNVPNGHNRLYYFRYLFVLNLLEKGTPQEDISKLLGHSDKTTVKDYISHALYIKKSISALGGKNG